MGVWRMVWGWRCYQIVVEYEEALYGLHLKAWDELAHMLSLAWLFFLLLLTDDFCLYWIIICLIIIIIIIIIIIFWAIYETRDFFQLLQKNVITVIFCFLLFVMFSNV